MTRWPRTALASVALALLATGCGGAPSLAQEGDGVTVVATFSVLADFARAVGGDAVQVSSLVGVGGDPHTYEPSPSDTAALADADVVLDNGLGLSPWFEALAGSVGGELVVVSDPVAEEAVEAGGELDPHMWMDPGYAAQYVTVIEEALAAADPDGAEGFAANAEEYRATLAGLDVELAERFETIPAESRKLVTSHDAYSYFAEAYGLEVIGTPVGVTTEEQPSAGTVAELVDLVRDEGVPTIFVETTTNPDVIEAIAADAGVEVGEPLYGDSVGEEGSGAEDYLGMMRANVESIVAGLGGDEG